MISRMRNIVQHNLPAKILALVIAVILWGYVMNDQNPSIENTYTVQLDVELARRITTQPDGQFSEPLRATQLYFRTLIRF